MTPFLPRSSSAPGTAPPRASGSSPRTVLQVIKAPQPRGAEVFALQLSAALRDKEWAPRLVSLYPGDGSFVRRAESAGLWGGAISGRRPAGPISWRTFRGLRALLERTGSRIVQANGADTLKYAALARLSGARVRLVYRNIGMPSFWRSDRSRRLVYRFLIGQADAIVAVCRRAAGELLDEGLPPDRMVVIPNGVDTASFLDVPPETRARVRGMRGMVPGDVVLAHVGSFTPEKNQRLLVRLLAGMRASGIPASLWLIGEGPERPTVERESETSGIRQYIWFTGARDDVAEILCAADIFVLPSATEGMPAALIEAGLAGLPAVAFDVGGVNEVVAQGRTGQLVPPGDMDAMRVAVTRLAADVALRDLMGAAAREACRRFDIRRIADDYAALYSRLAG